MPSSTKRYGNDDKVADALMTRTFQMPFESIDGRPDTIGSAAQCIAHRNCDLVLAAGGNCEHYDARTRDGLSCRGFA